MSDFDYEELKKKKELYELIRAYRHAIENIRAKGKSPNVRTFKRMYHLKRKLNNM